MDVGWIVFLKINKVNMSFQRKQLAKFVASDQIQAFEHKLEFEKFVSATVSFVAFQYLKVFPMRLVVILTKLIYFILYNEMCR